MKKFVLVITALVIVVSCKNEDKKESEIAEVPVEKVTAERFDKKFFGGTPDDLPQLKEDYPYLFPEGNEDEVWINKMRDPFQLKLYEEVQKKFPSVDGIEKDLEELFKHIKYYYPDFQTSKVVTLVSDDIETKAVYADGLLLIPLSLYLGKDNYLYEGLPKYQVQQFTSSQILPDVTTSFAAGKVAPPSDRTLLSLMIYFGKELYMQDLLLPDVPDADKIGYTPKQLQWAQENESEMWRYFVEKNMLYDTDPKLPARFINPAPFSKFYLELDNESPGRLGRWLGWQIVRAYAENNKNVTLQELLATDAKTIFEKSKYKPKK
ncbi:gliding motility lipoprotein GldB [Flavobacterium salilacus subsp. salilacus]|uniref:gliding motility lipoprotein GldB n=1 Tax=Flavobacterium TaxID=237 RepID=UPI00107538C9|nr:MULTISPECIES: gliding motility lipoprotein GldB [Flavobacterium]KAF2518110.1 gliding motility lipoprotein GldB [Flavobacterium salilacus subsp. salilacus]MBE1615580.1 gliding motility lipoprotein GldB [Flavobacterium sp. SaA2.13]